ncbi:hypothetical protein E6W39_21815 [Kitasatospora acidiphila]|uniref:Secreted protein n=1 Tax=Kitasatospora acidiphila TaxID=2567942 RepID=A0A540W5U3_9ACTN|nr:hypothetical protein [Kitasatospora acidiphila]TQF04376.1 hypothetical protein E6W39_21815 [Kitasatospora acidiphila]
MKRLKRASIAVAMMGALSSVAIIAGAGTATAAPAGYVNDFVQTFYTDPNPPTSVQDGYDTAWSECWNAMMGQNMMRYNNTSGANGEYFYCADGPNGGENLWWRHAV